MYQIQGGWCAVWGHLFGEDGRREEGLPAVWGNAVLGQAAPELRPEELVRDLVVKLHLGGLDEGAEGLRAAFQISTTQFYSPDILEPDQAPDQRPFNCRLALELNSTLSDCLSGQAAAPAVSRA